MQVSSDMEKLTEEGINSFKFFLAYKGAMAVTDQQLLSGLRRSKELGALPLVSHLCMWRPPMVYFPQHLMPCLWPCYVLSVHSVLSLRIGKTSLPSS